MTILAATAIVAALATAPKTPPDPIHDCPIGLICFTPSEVGEIDKRYIQMERDLGIARARVKRLGVTAGCGPGVAVELIEGKMGLRPAVMCGLVWGFRW